MLARVLPGTYVRAREATRAQTLAHALCAYDPAAVLRGESAAALHLQRGRWRTPLDFASPRRWEDPPAWLRPTRATVPADVVVPSPLPHVDAATAALQLATTEGPGVIDRALKRRLVTPQDLTRAVDALARTSGNRQRRQLVAEALGSPKTASERALHAALRRSQITGWVGNHRVLALGHAYVVDVAFPDHRVGIEVDDWATHRHPENFVDDRVRHNQLTAAGWRILHLTEGMVADEPLVVADWVRRVLRAG